MKTLPMIIFMFILCSNVDAATYRSGDFDQDGVVDNVVITRGKDIQLKFTPSSTNKMVTYSLDYLHDSDNGFSDLYKYNEKNYIVSYYSDYQIRKDYSVDLYKWDSKLSGFILYLSADIQSNSNSMKVETKIAKCCYKLGDSQSDLKYFNDNESKSYARKLIGHVKNQLNSGAKKFDDLTLEEVYFISGYYSHENRDVFIALESFFKTTGDKRTYKMLENLLDSDHDDTVKESKFISADKAMLYCK